MGAGGFAFLFFVLFWVCGCMDVKLFKSEIFLADAFIVIDQQPPLNLASWGRSQSTQPCLMVLTLGTPHSKDITNCQGL